MQNDMPPSADEHPTAAAMNSPSQATSNSASDDAAAAAEIDRSFGDLLAQLLRTLPTEASTLFLKALSGLSPGESCDLSEYVAKLRTEKQFRVIRAMAESTIEGKKRFLANLRKKFEQQEISQRAAQAQAEQDMEAHLKRKQALTAAARVKQMNAGANKFHSFNAAVGAGLCPEGVDGTLSSSNSSEHLTSDALMRVLGDSNPSAGRSLSSSSIIITKEDIKNVGAMLGNAHIGESEQNLRELEISKKGFLTTPPPSTSSDSWAERQTEYLADDGNVAKRERPESSRALTQMEQKPQQRTRSDYPEDINSLSPRDSVDGGIPEEDGTAGENGGADDDPDAPTTKRWTKSQDAALRESVRLHGEKNWKAIAELVPGRNHAQCLQRWRKVLKPGLVKGHWSFEEDQVLEYLVLQGCNNWGQIAERIPGRTPKQCRERWKNHLDPAINKGPYTEEEDRVIFTEQARLGNKWSQIAQLLKGRTEDSVKIRWKSLKQNPSKAAASHAQHKKNQQQAAAAAAAAAGQVPGQMPGYSPNTSAILRQRQMALLQQQQQMQHVDATTQQQMHMRMMQQHRQQQLQSHVAMLTESPPHSNQDGGASIMPLKPEPYQSSGRMLPQMDPHTYAASSGEMYLPPTSQASASTSSPMYHKQHAYDPHEYSSGGGYASYSRYSVQSPSRDDTRESTDSWDLHQDLTDGLDRFGENPPPVGLWEPVYQHRQDDDPLPIALHSLLQEPQHRQQTAGIPSGSFTALHASSVQEDEYDPMMMVASEFGSHEMHFNPI